MLTGKALDVYTRLSQEDATNYDKLKLALLRRYNFTEHGYRQRFREARPEGQESPGQFVVRLNSYLNKWVELSGREQTYEGVINLIVHEQFTNSCPKDLAVYLMERKYEDLEELASAAEQYLVAHNKKFSSRDVAQRRENGKAPVASLLMFRILLF